MKVALYRRVSTEMQKEEGFSLEAQKMRLESFAISQDWQVVGDYCDDGYSAKNTERPALQRMISDMKQRKFDVVLVYRLDRFVRNVRDLHELLEMMDKYDVKFKSSTEVFDTTTATGRLFITIIATLAQWERETIAERVYDSMLKRSEKGKWNGGTVPFGYELKEGKLVLIEEEAKWVRFIYEKYAFAGSQKIAKILNQKGARTKKGFVWSDFAVRSILTNPIYTGMIRWGKRTTSKGKVAEEIIQPIEQEDFIPIIPKEQFDEVRSQMKERGNKPFSAIDPYPFTGILHCPRCGKPMTGSRKPRKNGTYYRFYKCAGRFSFGICDAQSVAEEAVEDAFLEALDIPDVDVPIEGAKEEVADPNFLGQQLSKIAHKKERLKELYIDGDIKKYEYLERMKDLSEQEQEINELLLPKSTEEVSQELVLQGLRNIKKEWHRLSLDMKKAAIHSLFEYITYDIVEPAVTGRYSKPATLKIKDYRFR